MGHIFRCLALAEMLKQDFEILFVSKDIDSKKKEIINTTCSLVEIEELNNEQELLKLSTILSNTDILVLDGYNYDEHYQVAVKKMVKKLVMIDDQADKYYYADLIINHGGECLSNLYKTQKDTKVLTGFKYLIVRDEFIKASTQSKTVNHIKTAFICMGGADPFNITIKVLTACITVGFFKNIIVVVGNAYNNITELTSIIHNSKKEVNILLENNIDAKRMVELIKTAEISICPSSSIALEVCCVKSGLITGTVIENQIEINKQLVKNGCAINLGDFRTITLSQIIDTLNQTNSIGVVNAMIKNQSKATSGLKQKLLLNELNLLNG